jgi:hypothetical protein
MALGDVIKRLAVSLSLETVAFEKGATLAEKRAAQMQRKFSKLGDQIGKLGQTMTLGLTVPLAAFGVSAFKAASDAGELQSAFDQTFGAMSKSMNDWAETTGNALGRSTQEMQRAANTFGIFFNQAAPTAQAAADMSKEFAVLAQDLASFYNVDVQTAVDKLRSGLTGEAEPLRDFGVFLNEAAVKAQALEMGLGGVGRELTEQEKIQARYALILESTANAQGDVARTSGSTANQMRAAQAAFEELQVVIGTKLLPVITPLITKLADALNWFSQLPAPVQDFTLIAGGLATALGPVLMGLGQIIAFAPKIVAVFKVIRIAALALMANPVLLGFAAVLAGIYLAWQNWDKIGPVVGRLYLGVKKWIVEKLGAVFDWLRDKIKAVTGFFYDMYDAVVGNSYVPDMVDGIAAQMARLQREMVDPAQKATASVTDAAREMAQEVSSLLDRLFPEIAAARQMIADRDLLRNAGLDPRAEEAARLRLVGGDGKASVSLDEGPLAQATKVTEAAEKMANVLGGVADRAKIQTVRIAESFRDMAQNSIRAFDDMVNAIKGGGFLNILGSAVNLFLQLGSTGLFGKGLAGRINQASVPGFAQGTRYAPGGLAMVGERGPELVNLPRGSQVISNRDLRAANSNVKLQVEVIANNNGFGAVVRNLAGQVVAEAAPAIAAGASSEAISRIQRMQNRRLA